MTRKILSLTLALLMVVFAAGCSNTNTDVTPTETSDATGAPAVLDAASLYEKMQEATGGKMATSFTSTTEVGLAVDAGVISMDSGISASTNVKLSADPFALYSETELKASIMAFDLSQKFEVYSQTGDEGVTSYYHLDSADTWLHMRSNADVSKLLSQYAVTGLNWTPNNLTLAEQTQILNDREVYVLSCDFSAQDVLDAVRTPMGEFYLDGVDLSMLKLATVYYVDAATFLPVQIETEFDGIGEALGDKVSEYISQMLSDAGIRVDAEINAYREVLSGLTYDAVMVPTVPEEGAANSQDIADFDMTQVLKMF